MSLAVLISKKGLRLASKTVQGTAIFTLLLALLPILLVIDGEISRGDGLIFNFCIFNLFLLAFC